jgi:hypothetical protein
MNDKIYMAMLASVPVRAFHTVEEAERFIMLKKKRFKSPKPWSVGSCYFGFTDDESDDIRDGKHD